MPIVFPPRGAGPDATEAPQDRRWGEPTKLGPSWDYSGRKVLLGQWGGRLIGDPDRRHLPQGSGDDRHIVTIAGSRAGKPRTVLAPNLRRYPGSVVVIDPKGELVRDTAADRRKLGEVFVLDPFGITGETSASFNPFQELIQSSAEAVTADAALVADALIIDSREAHWTDAAKNLIRGLLLHQLSKDPARTNIRTLRTTLTASPKQLNDILDDMVLSDAYEGIVANTGRGFKGKLEANQAFTGELRSIISTSIEQTWPLDDVARISDRSDFLLSDLSEKPITVYLVLPATRLATHHRWLRLFINLAIAALERRPVDVASGGLPVWFVLEEFAALGHMRALETAAGFMAGMGCKLWVVLQDLTQLETHYPKSWETFLGNAGVIQAWSNIDVTTTEYLSKLIGQTTIVQVRRDQISSQNQERGDSGKREELRTVPLLDPVEITQHFARETGRQLILSPGRPPIFIERMPQ